MGARPVSIRKFPPPHVFWGEVPARVLRLQFVWSPRMSRLNESHRRRLLAAFRHADELLIQSLTAVDTAPPGLCRRHIRDFSEAEARLVENHIEKIREHISSLLERLQIVMPRPSTPSSWVLRTNLMSLDIILEDLYPEKMRGYGDMDPAAAGDLAQGLNAIRQHVRQLLASLAEANTAREQRAAQHPKESAMTGEARGKAVPAVSREPESNKKASLPGHKLRDPG